MPVSCGSIMCTSPTSYQLLAAKQEPYKKANRLTQNIDFFSSGNKSGEWASRQKKREDRKSNGSRKKNTGGDSKLELNDTPEIPDRGKQQTSPASLRGIQSQKRFVQLTRWKKKVETMETTHGGGGREKKKKKKKDDTMKTTYETKKDKMMKTAVITGR